MAEFTGACTVRERTGDGVPVGRCFHATYDGICPRHGDVRQWLATSIDERDLEAARKEARSDGA